MAELATCARSQAEIATQAPSPSERTAMDGLIRVIGLGLRFPIALLGYVVITGYWIGFTVLVLPCVLVLLPILWLLLRVPWAIASVSFIGDGAAEFKELVAGDRARWRALRASLYEEFPDAYSGISRWLAEGFEAG